MPKASPRRAVRRPPMRRPPPISETAEHLTIASYLRKIGLGDDAIMWHVRAERHGARQRATAARMGVLSGMPDWQVLYNGQTGFIELKPRGWRARREKHGNYTKHELAQLERHKQLRRAGAWVAICETFEDVLATLQGHGVLLRSESKTTERIRRGIAKGLGSHPELRR